jgi:hypothetical protein
MAGLIILKYTHNPSDEALCERWVENPYYQYFCGEEFFQHELVLGERPIFSPSAARCRQLVEFRCRRRIRSSTSPSRR